MNSINFLRFPYLKDWACIRTFFSIITLKANVTSLVLFPSITSYCCSVLSLYTYYITRLLENWYQYTFSSLFRHHLTFQDCAKQADQKIHCSLSQYHHRYVSCHPPSACEDFFWVQLSSIVVRYVFLLYLGLFVLALSRVHHYDWLNGWMGVSLIVNYASHIIVGIFLLNYTKSRIILFIRCTFRLINKSCLYLKKVELKISQFKNRN